MNNKTSVLLVDDEKAIRNFMSASLSTEGYRIIQADCGNEAISLAGSYNPELIILDLGLPDMDGLEVLKKIRETSSVPIVIVSARGCEDEKVKALDLGADDYVTKSFGTQELLARIRTALRHSNRIMTKEMGYAENFKTGGLEIDFEKRVVTVDGKVVHLTIMEYKILGLLSRYVGKVLTYEFILNEVWGTLETKNNQILRVNMANIRRKLEKNPAEPKYILTDVGVGYRMMDLD